MIANLEEKNRKVLCVDDEQNVLHSLKRTLGRHFQLDTALNGEEALQKLQIGGPYAVVMTDYNMPGMNGIQLLQRAQTVAPDTVLIMLTGNAERQVAVQTVNETEVFRFLAKPCAADELRKSLNDAVEHFHLIESKKRLTAALAEANAQLTTQYQELAHELELAKSILGNINARNNSHFPGVNSQLLPVEKVGGDLILSSVNDSGILYAILGDMTGHGLSAALGALLVAEAFENLSADNCSLDVMVRGINEKLCQTLPPGLFCAAVLVRVDIQGRSLSIWHGGLPDAYLLDRYGQPVEIIKSSNLPLGIREGLEWPSSISHYSIEDIDALFVCSDGVTEQTDANRQMFGEGRVLTALQQTPDSRNKIDYLLENLSRFRADAPQSDDLSLFELDFSAIMKAIDQVVVTG